MEATPTPVYMVSKEQMDELVSRIVKEVGIMLGAVQSRAVSDDDEQLIGYTEASRLLGVGKTTLWRYINAGKITPVRLSSQAVKFRKSEILKMMGV